MASIPHSVLPLENRTARARSVLSRRAFLVVAGTAAVVVALLLGDPAPRLQADPDLALLLRGMALIKACALVGAMALVGWRFARPLPTGVAAAYGAGTTLMAGATALIWQLSWVATAAIAWHVALLVLLVVAWRFDDGRSIVANLARGSRSRA